MTVQLTLAAERDQCRHCDQAAIALRQAWSFPDVPINHLLGQFDELWRDRSNLLGGG
jgi:hypothetical protein